MVFSHLSSTTATVGTVYLFTAGVPAGIGATDETTPAKEGNKAEPSLRLSLPSVDVQIENLALLGSGKPRLAQLGVVVRGPQ